MEKGEPTLVPQWLKASTGNSVRGGNTTHHLNSVSQLDDSSVLAPSRSRSSHLQLPGSSISDYDGSNSSLFGERNSVSHFRRTSSSNGGVAHDKDPLLHSRSYSNFGRNHRSYDYDCDRGTPRSDRNRDRDRERDFGFRERDMLPLGDVRDRDRNCADSLTNNITIIGSDKETLRQSQSVVSSKKVERNENRIRRPGSELGVMNNGMVVAGSYVSSIHKAAFERDFPSLGSEDKHGQFSVGVDIGRVPSPSLNSVAQGLPLGSAALIGGDGWTSALAEVPVIIGSNNPMLSSVQQSAAPSASLVSPSTATGLNMAETLAQAPARARTTPQLSVETQKLEELAIKQSRQLIPMTPSMPKNSALGSSDKPKAKTARPGSLLVNSVRGPVKADTPKTSQGGKLLVLKPNRDKNGISPMSGDSLGPSNTTAISSSSSNVSLPAGFVPSSLKNPKLVVDVKLSTSAAGQISDDKKPSSVHGQNRIEFFNSLRRKTTNMRIASDQPNPTLSSDAKLAEPAAEAAFSDQMKDIPVADSEGAVHVNGDARDESVVILDDCEKVANSNGGPIMVAPEEEEAAFLRSLGWEENAGEEALTEEEINAFYELLKLRPSASFRHKAQQFNDSVPESN